MKRKPVAKTRSDGGAFSGDAQVDAALSELAKVLLDIARNEQVAERGNDEIEETKDVSSKP